MIERTITTVADLKSYLRAFTTLEARAKAAQAFADAVCEMVRQEGVDGVRVTYPATHEDPTAPTGAGLGLREPMQREYNYDLSNGICQQAKNAWRF